MIREQLPNEVLLADFERLVQVGENPEGAAKASDRQAVGSILELCRFIDHHGRQLLDLARKGANTP